MKTFGGRFFWMVVVILISIRMQAQNPTYLCELRNDVQVSSTVFEFDIYLLQTGSTPLEYAAGQFGILVNPQIKNGGVITASIVAGSSDPALVATSQNPISITFTSTQNCIKIAGRMPPGTGFGAIISNISPGTKVCRVRLTNTVAFGQFQPNLTWTTTTIYPTQIRAYVGGLNTDITVGSSQTTDNLSNHTLPIQLISFDGQCNEKDVELNWMTASETNNDFFTIQKSTDALNFEDIANVNGAGNSTENRYYSLSDIPYENITTYYRLKQTDFDGTYSFSKIISTDCNINSDGSQYYNILVSGTKEITIIFNTIKTYSAVIKIFDISGKELATVLNVENIGDGQHKNTYSFTRAGIYIVKAVINNKVHTNKIIIS